MSDDDILDMTPEPKKPAPKERKKPGRKGHQTGGIQNAEIIQALLQPVSIGFLASVLKKDRRSITGKLSAIEPAAYHREGMPLYDFREAVSCLVPPKITSDHIKGLRASDLPASLQKDVWDARLKEQKWKAQAGELWQTGDVLEVLGEAFTRLKTTTQLWIDSIADNHGLPTKAREELTKLVDGLQADLHRTLVEMPAEKQTRSYEAVEDEDDE